jgi:hypothetical protein
MPGSAGRTSGLSQQIPPNSGMKKDVFYAALSGLFQRQARRLSYYVSSPSHWGCWAVESNFMVVLKSSNLPSLAATVRRFGGRSAMASNTQLSRVLMDFRPALNARDGPGGRPIWGIPSFTDFGAAGRQQCPTAQDQPSLRDLGRRRVYPALKRWAIFGRSFGTGFEWIFVSRWTRVTEYGAARRRRPALMAKTREHRCAESHLML